jgi:hypothetical protein
MGGREQRADWNESSKKRGRPDPLNLSFSGLPHDCGCLLTEEILTAITGTTTTWTLQPDPGNMAQLPCPNYMTRYYMARTTRITHTAMNG